MEQSNELRELTLRFYKAMENADSTFFEDIFSQEEGVLVIGSDPAEWWAGHATIVRILKTQMEEMTGVKILDANPLAFSEGTVGWVSDQAKMKLPDVAEIPFRITGTFHQEDGEWKII